MPLSFKVRDYAAEVKIVGEQMPVVAKDSLMDGQFFIVLGKSEIQQQTTKLIIEVWSEERLVTTAKTTFIGPAVTHSSE